MQMQGIQEAVEAAIADGTMTRSISTATLANMSMIDDMVLLTRPSHLVMEDPRTIPREVWTEIENVIRIDPTEIETEIETVTEKETETGTETGIESVIENQIRRYFCGCF